MGFRGALVGGFRKDDVLSYIEETAKERTTLQEQLNTALEEKESLDADRSALTAVVEQLNAQLEEMDELRDELEQLQSENEELREREAEAQQAAMMCEQMMGTMQMNIDKLEEEIRAIKASCKGHILKVIIETCLLTDEEKIEMCRVVTAAGADYIKTSTGFSTAGATREDVALFKAHVGPNVKIKAAGGISSLQDAEDFVALGADRLGTSRIVKLVKGQQGSGY